MDSAKDETPQSPAPRHDIDLETENLIATYEQVAEWIRFADAKAAAVLTVVAAIAGTLIPTYKDFSDSLTSPGGGWDMFVTLLFAAWLLLGLISSVFAFRCILPYRRKGEHPSLEACSHFHPAAICANYGINDLDKFSDGYRKAGVEGYQREVLAGLLIDSHISSYKYGNVTRSIRLLGWTVAVAMMYLLVIQF